MKTALIQFPPALYFKVLKIAERKKMTPDACVNFLVKKVCTPSLFSVKKVCIPRRKAANNE